jgi:aryl-phospho-beta-D-glucosidase BglC (GH1 family)
MKNYIMITILLFCFTVSVKAQLTPQDAITAMGRGINMGNTLEPPDGEGTWGNPAVVATNFDDYKNAGFSCVRIPITWDKHVDATAPYTINASWLNRIEQIVDWGLNRKLIIIINAHHDGWIKDAYTPDHIARFDSLWSQIARRFKDKTDSLLFEIINEPNPLSLANVNDLNARTLATIRKTNPTRIVLFSGHMWSNSSELVQAAIPDTSDRYLIGYYHSYDPYPFGLEGPGTYGSDADIAATVKKMQDVTTWGSAHNIPVVLGEFAYTYKCEYNSRMCAYATIVEKAQLFNIATMVWEDGGDFKFYNRPQRTWTEIKDVLIHTYKESPNKLRINNFRDTLVQLRWNNRTTENDSIIVERKIGTGNFVSFAKIAPTDSVFIDTTTSIGITYYYRLKANVKDSIEIQSYPVRIVNASVPRGPYAGTVTTVPGILEVENFDIGLEGETYHDSDFVNLGDKYRLGVGVDIYQTGTKYYVGNMAPGEWLEYSINVQREDDYRITANIGAVSVGGEFTLQFQNGTTPPFTALATGRLTSFAFVSDTFHIMAGQQIMRLMITKTPEFSLNSISFGATTSVAAENVPLRFELSNNYPNPFNPSTTIAFSLPSRSFVTLTIFDLLGREVTTLLSEELNSGKYARQWNAQGVSSGMYYYRIQAGNFSETKKMVILK